MINFEFYTPTPMMFGKNTHLQVGKLVKEYGFKKVLVLLAGEHLGYGGGAGVHR